MNKFSIMLIATCLAIYSHLAIAEENRIDTIRPDAPQLAHYGAYQTGVKTLHFVHDNQLDIVKAKAGEKIPVYKRPLTVEVWYPAALTADQKPGSTPLHALTRDGVTEVKLWGQAVRDAQTNFSAGPYPLLIISHGYPGNRFLLSHLAENLASKGYVVASIDHTDSTYQDQSSFASTLLNRSLDQLFVLNEMAKLNTDAHTGFKGMINAENTGLIGYSMGGYGVVNTIGGGLSEAAVKSPLGVPDGGLMIRQSGNASYLASMDKRIKAAVAFAPWGWNLGVWDKQGLAGITTPILYIAGSADDVSGYAPGVRNIYENTVNAPHYLLTFENANHNAGAPIPAPKETWKYSEKLHFIPAEHYLDATWDNVRMNNISQHFATAFLDKYLKNDASKDAYLNLLENAKDGKWSVAKDGSYNNDHTYWKGFQARTAIGLRLEHKQP
ncbi:alpha/beta hydrolase family protein [Undibacterium sp. SXout11W]|uniref:alpha/beta hydrolase family protein n=1 Tax=Undibacterium sp. SXout11W TaxID=3413050 RepID=UPI003BF17E36